MKKKIEKAKMNIIRSDTTGGKNPGRLLWTVISIKWTTLKKWLSFWIHNCKSWVNKKTDNSNGLITMYERESVKKQKNYRQTKVQHQMTSLEISTKQEFIPVFLQIYLEIKWNEYFQICSMKPPSYWYQNHKNHSKENYRQELW